MTDPTSPITVYPLTLTETAASEHIYEGELSAALSRMGITFVDCCCDADVVHLFEVNVFTRDAITAFRIPELIRVLRSDTPIVVSTDDLYFIEEPWLTARPRLYQLNRQVQRWLFRQCDAIIAISESVRKTLEPEIPDTEISVVHHGVNERYFTDATEPKEPFVLHASLVSKRKNPETIVEVARRLDHRFVVAGGGWEERIPAELKKDHVDVTGFVPEETLIELYQNAGVFYFPTLHEGFGLPVLEAMAAANAVVCSDVYSIPEITGETAVLHDPFDTDGHVTSLRTLLEDENKRANLAKKARERARQFSWERSAAGTRAVYESVLER